MGTWGKCGDAFKIESFDYSGKFGHPQALIFDRNRIDDLCQKVIAFNHGLFILATAPHFRKVFATLGKQFHATGRGIFQDGHAMNPTHTDVLVDGQAKRRQHHNKGQKS